MSEHEIRPKTISERVCDGELSLLEVELDCFPHCDPKILHAPDECDYCSMEKFAVLREDRETLGVNYTGHATRAWSCPAEYARSMEAMNRWGGNRPKKN